MSLLENQKVTRKHYRGGWFTGDKKALTDISLKIKEDGGVGVIGRSGAGE